MNPYAIAYSIGYYYGRAYPRDAEVALPAADEYHRGNQGFEDGLEAGRRDYEQVDLPLVALAAELEAE